MQKKIVFWSITVALGGFLFGFDTAVISGAEKAIQEVWNLNVFEHGLTVSIALIGTVFGALFGGIPSDKIGRKNTLFWIGTFYLISALGSALAFDWYSFLIFRFLGGLGVGASSVAAPMYITEISPAKSRGRLVALFQFNVVFGILIAYLSNYLIGSLVDDASWRLMLGIEAVPSVLFIAFIFLIPKSPRWLIYKRGDLESATKIFKIIDPETAEEQVQNVLGTIEETKTKAKLWSKKYSFPIALAITIAVFNQLTGINAIIYYAPRILEMAGLGAESALLSTAGIGLVNFLSTLFGIYCIDKYGRRTLMFWGSIGLILTLSLVSYSFYTDSTQGLSIVFYLFGFVASFALSQGAVIWVFISEIFPNEVRAQGQSLGSFTHWLLAAVIAFTFPVISSFLGGGTTFLIFAIMMALQLIFVWKFMPETAGKSLEVLSADLD